VSQVSDSDKEDDIAENVTSEDDEDNNGNQNLVSRAVDVKVKEKRGRKERVIAPEECRGHLRRLFRNESVICSLLYGRHGPFAPISPQGLSRASADIFFMEVMPVSPTRFRPPAKMGETIFEHPQNELLSKILRTSYRLRDLNTQLRAASTKDVVESDSVTTRTTIFGTLLETLIQLQVDVNSFVDSSKNPTLVRQGKLPPAGVKQGLEKKDGLFRMHMMACLSR